MANISFLLWVIVLLAGFYGALTLGLVVSTAESAPQQAAGAAMALAYAAVPYVIARAWDAIAKRGEK